MKIVIAPDSFKNCLSAPRVAAAIARGIRSKMPDCQCVELPLADGGEGTCETLTSLFPGGKIVRLPAHDALMRPIDAFYGDLGNGRAVFEMAAASGIEHLKKEDLSAGHATTFGAGEILRHLLEKGFDDIVIGIGGSASTDAGAGFLQALGAVFFDREGRRLPDGIGGDDLERIEAIDATALQKLPPELHIRVACDVTNPLTGPKGSAHVFSPQKGADAAEAARLDRGLEHFLALCVRQKLSRGQQPGDGAAGGLGFALRNFVRSEMQSGAKLVFGLAGFRRHLADAFAVITGEGRTDAQTGGGKLCSEVAKAAAEAGKKTFLISGAITGDPDELGRVFDVFMSISPGAIPLEEAIASAEKNLFVAGMNVGALLKAGLEIRR